MSWDNLYGITKESPLVHSQEHLPCSPFLLLPTPNTTLSPMIPGKLGRSPLLTGLCFHVDVPSQYRIGRNLCWRGWCTDILGSWIGFAGLDSLSSREVKVSLTLLSMAARAKTQWYLEDTKCSSVECWGIFTGWLWGHEWTWQKFLVFLGLHVFLGIDARWCGAGPVAQWVCL